ncbi:MAG: zinc-dependent alcohol dehydrogenase family protein [Tabrizicola sp.]|uniref:zinc-dependent alcohol dehydrogenase family protein n=1 Tax=Tabrizicola sp. TaxID=2005166 RepID=UPI002AB892E2|nr:zinc-dependent alcohol dehydrogenase family protein [Tabrizicola sp.]MDZ4086517.1 zinc-dependent alcohol dehydrogenase family protein [Tabrizicola sp.]
MIRHSQGGVTMRAVRLQAVGRIELVKVTDPLPGPGEVLVRVLAAGICGTDRHLYKGEFPCAPPVTLGHEFAGDVVACGEGVTLPPGTRIACDPNIACGACDQCLRGRTNLCLRNVAIGIHRDGGFADMAVIPAHRAVTVADLDPHHAAFAEPLACTLHGLDLGAPVPGERVIVLGGGVIGLLAVQLARNAGAEVTLVTRHPAKRALALTVGATHTAATEAEARALLPQGADLVLECAGVAETVEMAPRLTRSGGRVVILGVMPQGQKVGIEPFDLLFREIRLLHSFINPFTQTRAAAMLMAGQVQVAPLISRIIPLSKAPEVIANPATPGEVKVLVVPG